jgi:5-methylcytosine-specific restriction endonuclease McrA
VWVLLAGGGDQPGQHRAAIVRLRFEGAALLQLRPMPLPLLQDRLAPLRRSQPARPAPQRVQMKKKASIAHDFMKVSRDCGCVLCPHHDRIRKLRARKDDAEAKLRQHLAPRWRQKVHCAHCRIREDKLWDRDAVRLEMDHIIPLSKGGDNALANLQFLCPRCHRAKTAKDFIRR